MPKNLLILVVLALSNVLFAQHKETAFAKGADIGWLPQMEEGHGSGPW